MADNTLPPGLDPENNRMINGKVYTRVQPTTNQDSFNYLGTNSGFNSLDDAKAADDQAAPSWQLADLSPGYSWGDIATKILLPMAAAGAGGSALAGLGGVAGAGDAASAGLDASTLGLGTGVGVGGDLAAPATFGSLVSAPSVAGLSGAASVLPSAAPALAGAAGGVPGGLGGLVSAPSVPTGVASSTLPSAAPSHLLGTLFDIGKAVGQAGQIAGQAAQSGATGQLAQAQYELNRDRQAEQNKVDAQNAAVNAANQQMKNTQFTNAANLLAARQGMFGNMLGSAKGYTPTNLPAGVRVPTAGPLGDIIGSMAASAPTYADLAAKTAASTSNLPTLPNFVPAPMTPEPQTSGMQKALGIMGQIAPYASMVPSVVKALSWL